MALILPAVKKLVERHGHPDEIPMGALAAEGVPPVTAEKCEALLTSEQFSAEAGQAVAKWLRLIGEFSA
jgi:hypothetical protein